MTFRLEYDLVFYAIGTGEYDELACKFPSHVQVHSSCPDDNVTPAHVWLRSGECDDVALSLPTSSGKAYMDVYSSIKVTYKELLLSWISLQDLLASARFGDMVRFHGLQTYRAQCIMADVRGMG